MSFDEFVNNIIGYLKGEMAWSHFSQYSGTTRSMVLNFFNNNHKSVNGEQIRETVVERIGRSLKEDEIEKLEQITNTWREWQYIIGNFKSE